MAIRIASISVTLFILKEPKRFINYTQMSASEWQEFFHLELRAAARCTMEKSELKDELMAEDGISYNTGYKSYLKNFTYRSKTVLVLVL